MATYYYLAVNGSWADTANWSTSRGGAGGSGPPTSGDTVYIETGSYDIYTTGAVTGLTAVYCTAGYKGSLGTSASVAAIAGTLLVLQHSGAAYINGAWTTAACTSSTGQTFTFATAVTIGTLKCGLTGNVIIASNTVVTNVVSDGARVTILPTGTAPTSIVSAGNIDCQRSVGTLRIKSGATATVSGAASGITTAVYIDNDAVFNDLGAGTVVLLEVFTGGNYQASNNTYPKTVTTRTAHQGSTFSLYTKWGPITFTNVSDNPV